MIAETWKDGNSTLRIKSFLKKIVYRIRGEYTVESLIAMGLKVGRNFNPQLGVELDPSHCWLIEIGDDVTIAPHAQILAHDASTCLGTGYAKIGSVRIGDRVFIGAGSIVLPGVIIGSDVIIGAGSVVSKSIPDGSVYAGNPAEFVCTTKEFNEKHLQRREKLPVFDASYTLREHISMEKRMEQKEALENTEGDMYGEADNIYPNIQPCSVTPEVIQELMQPEKGRI